MSDINYKYKFDNSYNPIYVNGAIGGVNPQGEIIISFYLERNSLPKLQKVEIEDTTGIGVVKETEPNDYEKSFIRYIETGVIINYKTAKELHRWLGEHIQNLENIENLKNNGN
jgi:hypothetical protein